MVIMTDYSAQHHPPKLPDCKQAHNSSTAAYDKMTTEHGWYEQKQMAVMSNRGLQRTTAEVAGKEGAQGGEGVQRLHQGVGGLCIGSAAHVICPGLGAQEARDGLQS